MNFSVGDRVVLIDAKKSRFNRIRNGTVLTVTKLAGPTSDGLLLEFEGRHHPELDAPETYKVRADCVVHERMYNSPLWKALE